MPEPTYEQGTTYKIVGVIKKVGISRLGIELSVEHEDHENLLTLTDVPKLKYRKHDVITCKCVYDRSLQFSMISFPNVCIMPVWETFNGILADAVKKKFKETLSLCGEIESRLEDSGMDMCRDLPLIASIWCKEHNHKILLEAFGNILTQNHAIEFLECIQERINVRQILLLGISRYQIRDSRLSLDVLLEKCRKNPLTVPCISIQQCDVIGLCFDIEFTVDQRRCGIICRYVYEEMIHRGHIYTLLKNIQSKFPDFDAFREVLEKDYCITIVREEYVYITSMLEIQNKLIAFVETKTNENVIAKSSMVTNLSAEQNKAIKLSLNNKLSIIMGIPGSGKSHTIRSIVDIITRKGMKVVCCSFTGKAVSRINEVLEGKNALTINRLIANQLCDFVKYNYIIIDEASMSTSTLIYDLVEVCGYDVSYIFVGDCNQLPAIGHGQFFKNIIDSQVVPICELTHNYRVAENNDMIIVNAQNMINDPKFKFEEGDTFTVEKGNIENVTRTIEECKEFGIDAKDIVVLSPYVKGNEGVPEINKIMKRIYNKSNIVGHDESNNTWNVDDRVMMTENNKMFKVYNGECGSIAAISSKGMDIVFDNGSTTWYSFSKKMMRDYTTGAANESNAIEMSSDSLNHAYSCSIHKSQGSEWKVVIVYIPRYAGRFVNRNLVYTAITRAKEMCFVITPDVISLNNAAHILLSPKRDLMSEILMTNAGIEIPNVDVEEYDYEDSGELDQFLFDDF